MKHQTLTRKMLDLILVNRAVRTAITRRSHQWFFNIYFAEYIEYETAPFQYEMFDITQREEWKLFCLVAFRGSAKTTIMTQSFVLWSILGIRQTKFAVVVAQTQSQAKQHMMNIRAVLEQNDLLKRDLGPFREETEQWGASSLVFSRSGARITVVSVNESIRGIKHLQHRPDLIVIDDPEDLQSAKTKEGRDKIYEWFKGEIMPLGSKRTKVVVIGNVVHEHCLVLRLKSEIENNTTTGLYREYPLLNENNVSMWSGKFATAADVEEERKRIGNDRTWFREYMLKVLPTEDQIIRPEWIRYYDKLPDWDDPNNRYRMAASAVDLGIKDKNSSDPTAIVSGYAYGAGTAGKIYISPYFINKRMLFPEIITKIKGVSARLEQGKKSRTYIETVQAQSYVFQELKHQGYPVFEYNPRGDKADRLASISPLIQNGQILFPRGGEELINQIVNFGVENHDDLCDALTQLVIKLMEVIGHSRSGGQVMMGGKPITAGLLHQVF